MFRFRLSIYVHLLTRNVVTRGICLSECLSVRPSVCHTRVSRLNGSIYQNMLFTALQNDTFSFLTPNFAILNLGVHSERVRHERHSLLCRYRKQ